MSSMGKEEAIENRKMDKKIKRKSKKGEKKERGDRVMHEVENIGRDNGIGHAQKTERDAVIETKMRKKKDKEKKNNKGRGDAVEGDVKSMSREKLIGVYGEDSNGEGINNFERKKRKKEKKRKNEPSSNANSEVEIDENEGQEKLIGVYRHDSNGEGINNVERKKKKEKNKRKNEASGNVNSEVEIDENEGQEKLIGVHGQDSNEEGINNVERKKRKKEKNKRKNEAGSNANSEVEIDENEVQERHEDKSVFKMRSNKEAHEEEKSQNAMSSNKEAVEKVGRKKRKREKNLDKDYDCYGRVGNENSSGEILETFNEGQSKVQRKKKEKTKKKKAKHKDDEGVLSVPQQESLRENVEGNLQSSMVDGNTSNGIERKKKFKNTKNSKNDSSVAEVKKKKAKLVNPTPNKSNKKVRFSEDVEVFPQPDDSDKGNVEEDNLVRGKRFTKEEDEIVKEAVWKYIEEHDLGDEGLDMVLNCSKHPQVKTCWKEIGTAIPYRPYTAVYYRAHVLFQRSEKREWTQEEYDMILKYQKEHGNQWKPLAEELGKHRWHVKDTWRRIKFPNLKKGHWSQKEYQQLFDLVNADLLLKVSEEKKSQHGMLRDNIPWTAISDRLSTRTDENCCRKWYNQLTSPMVAKGMWADVDDYRMVGALYSFDANCMEDVDWDNLLDDRPGDVCRKRWNQMVLHIGKHGNKSFAEQVEVLAHRYAPHLLEAREAWDSKPVVP